MGGPRDHVPVKPQDTMTQDMRGAVSVPGTIDASVYRSIKQYLIPPMMKLVMLLMLVAYEAIMLWQAIATQAWANLIMMAVTGVLLVVVYRYNQNSVIKHVIKQRPELTQGGYRVTITFAGNIKLMNHTTGVERNLAYANVVSMAESDKCIALFAKGRKYMLVPKGEMTEQQREAVLRMLKEHVPGIKTRR